MNHRLFSLEAEEFLKEAYSEQGGEYCAYILDIPVQKVRTKCNKLGLKVNKTVLSSIKSKTYHYTQKPLNAYAVDATKFFNPATKEIAYILGFLWADGYLYEKKHTISLKIVLEDLEVIKPYFMETGAWRFYTRSQQNRKPQGTLLTTNKPLFEFLKNLDYVAKSSASACKILNIVPENLRYMWFRGLVDGDGNFYYNKRDYCRQFSIASSFTQDWTYVENLFKSLDIFYKIDRKENFESNNKSSMIRLSNTHNIRKLGDYLYPEPYDNIGLLRKFNKFMEIYNS